MRTPSFPDKVVVYLARVQPQRFLQVTLRLVGRNEVRQKEGMVRGVGREEQVVFRSQLVDSLQQCEGESLLSNVEALLAVWVW